jgi:hypothetical protein
VYAAAGAMTAAWEARLCLNDVTDPGTFYLAPGAEAALICTVRRSRCLRRHEGRSMPRPPPC